MQKGKKPCDLIHDCIVEVCEIEDLNIAHQYEGTRTEFIDLIYNKVTNVPILRFHYGVWGFWDIEEINNQAKDIFMLIMSRYYGMIKR